MISFTDMFVLVEVDFTPPGKMFAAVSDALTNFRGGSQIGQVSVVNSALAQVCQGRGHPIM